MEKSKQVSIPFSTLVTHELSGSVRGLRISLERLETEHGSQLNDKTVSLLNDAVKASKKIQQILHRLTGIAESELCADDEVFDSLASVESVLVELDCEIRARGASVIVDVLPQVRYKQQQFETIMLNLIRNALLHSSSPNLIVEIGARTIGDTCCFFVKDNGVGISAQRQARIFDPHLRDSSFEPGGRLGLGLFLCKRLVEANKGQINVISTEGFSTEFSFTIPLKKND